MCLLIARFWGHTYFLNMCIFIFCFSYNRSTILIVFHQTLVQWRNNDQLLFKLHVNIHANVHVLVTIMTGVYIEMVLYYCVCIHVCYCNDLIVVTETLIICCILINNISNY